MSLPFTVIPAQAGIHCVGSERLHRSGRYPWTPACAGMTMDVCFAVRGGFND